MLQGQYNLYITFNSILTNVPATSLANGSSGFGAESSAWIDNNTVLICKAGLHLSIRNIKMSKNDTSFGIIDLKL